MMDQNNQGFNPEEMFNAAANQEEGPNQPRPQIYLPQANVVEIMRGILPSNARISDEAKETMQVCVSNFINHITAEANRNRYDQHRETIVSEDLIASMAQRGFSEYVEPLTMMLNTVRSQERAHASPYMPLARTRVRNLVNPQVMARGTRALNANPQPVVDNAPPPAQNDEVHWSADDYVDYDRWPFGDGDQGGSSSGNNL